MGFFVLVFVVTLWCVCAFLSSAAFDRLMSGTDGCQTHVDSRSRGDGWQTQNRKTWLSGQVRAEKVMAEAVMIDG